MSKSIRKLIAVIAVSLACVLMLGLLAACGEKSPDDGGDDAALYQIDVSGLTFPEGEINVRYSIPIPQVKDRQGNTVTEFEVEIKELKDPEGAVAPTAVGGFTPKQFGTYTVTYTCNDERVKDASATFKVLDTGNPVINTSTVNKFMFVGQEYDMPALDASDAGGIDETKGGVKLLNSDGEDITPENGKITFTEPGLYSFTFTAYDLSGNSATETVKVFVTETEAQPGQITYWDAGSEALAAQITSAAEAIPTMPMPKTEWVTTGLPANAPSEVADSGALKITATETARFTGFALTCAITDWTDYDYLGFWIYNPTDYVLVAGFIRSSDEHTFILDAKAWTYITLDAKQGDYIDANYVGHDVNDRQQIVFGIYDRYGKDATGGVTAHDIETGTTFYMSNIVLGKNADDDVLIHFGEKASMQELWIHEGFMDTTFAAVEKSALPDGIKDTWADPYALRITRGETAIASVTQRGISIRYKVSGDEFDSEYPYYLLTVYNPNDYDIIVIDDSYAGNAAEGTNYSTIIKAGKTGQALIQIRNSQQSFLSVWKLNGSGDSASFGEMADGDCVYFGNIATTDQFKETEEITLLNWNEKYGNAKLAEFTEVS